MTPHDNLNQIVCFSACVPSKAPSPQPEANQKEVAAEEPATVETDSQDEVFGEKGVIQVCTFRSVNDQINKYPFFFTWLHGYDSNGLMSTCANTDST